MNLSGFDDCMQAASEIQSSTEGTVPNHLGTSVNAPVSGGGEHISQFNAGLDAMQTLNNSHIPLSESGSYQFDIDILQDNVDSIENWLKAKLVTENGNQAEAKTDHKLEKKTEFLKDMGELFNEMDKSDRESLIKSISSYIEYHDIASVRSLISKINNAPVQKSDED
jgi:predicted HNH restriction endonuclease